LAQRLNRVQNRLDLISADPESGTAKLVLRESDPHWVNLSSDLRLFKDSRRFLWSSERSGFRHLYVYTMDGKLERQLTSGDWEVSEVVCLDETGGVVYYTSTEASPLERRLYRAALDGSGRRVITPEAGFHRVSMSPGCGHAIDAYSSLSEPTRRVLRGPEGNTIAELDPADRRPVEELDLLPVEILPVKAQDGETLYARLIRPAHFDKSKKYPAIVMVYGGPHSQAVQNSWRGVSFEQALAHRGFVVWQLDNRGSAGRGHAWEAKLFRRFGKQELEDQKTGVQHLVGMGFVDAARVGIHGWSYGGFMTLYAMLHAPDTFRAGVAGAPVTEWRNYDTIYTERYLGLPSENPEAYRESSPVHFAANLKGRLMLIHNYQDDNVLFQNTFQMMGELQRAGKLFDLMIYPQKTHGVTGRAQRHLREAILAFFERELR
jgi:dipeptidyl-peptidase-4